MWEGVGRLRCSRRSASPRLTREEEKDKKQREVAGGWDGMGCDGTKRDSIRKRWGEEEKEKEERRRGRGGGGQGASVGREVMSRPR